MTIFNMFRQKDGVAIGTLCAEIYDSSFTFADSLENHLEGSRGKEGKKTHLLFEFLYFFLHMTDRIAFNKLGSERRNIFIDTITAVVLNHTMKVYFKDDPQEVKDKLEIFFLKKSYEASMDYAGCDELLSEEDPFSSDDALFSKLAKRVCILLGEGHLNPVMLQRLVMIITRMWDEMNFEKLVGAALKDNLD